MGIVLFMQMHRSNPLHTRKIIACGQQVTEILGTTEMCGTSLYLPGLSLPR